MKQHRVWLLPAALLLVVGTLGGEGVSAPVTESGPGIAPEIVEEEPEQSSTKPEEGRDEAIAAIERLGGSYQCGKNDGSPIWFVDLANTQVTDAELEYLKGLSYLNQLNLSRTPITGTGLVHLQGLTDIHWLNLGNSQITDAGLEHLKGLTNLNRLDLRNTHVTDAGLEYLSGLTDLHSLILNDTRVTEEGVKKLQQALPTCKIEH